MKTKHVRVGSITDDLAEKIIDALEGEDIIMYRKVGPRLVDVYIDTYIEDKRK